VGRLEGWLVRRPDAVVVSSVATLPLLAEQGVPTSRVASLPDGAALEYFVPRPPDEALLDQLGLRGKRIVVFLGVLTAYQGVDALIDAVPDVVRAIPDAHFLIMGYPHEARYRAVVAERGLQSWITLPGRIPYQEAPRWLSLGVLSVSPKIAVTEANGKLLNYMSCGLPVVASDTTVNRELLGSAGVYAPPGDASALAGRIVELLEDPDRRRSLGARLRSRAESEFDWVSLTDRLLSIYRRCLDAAPGPR
jgi:glycosyltransferase involved in cell wall biosynthesis